MTDQLHKGFGQQAGGDLLTEIFNNSLEPRYVDAPRQGTSVGFSHLFGRITALVTIGFLLAVAYLKVVAEAPEATKARDKLVADIRRDQATTDRLEDQANQLRGDVAAMRDRALSDAGGDVDYVRGLEALTGLGKVSGSGVTVTVGDADNVKDPVTGRPKSGTSGKVYDRDLQRIVNAVWSVGAEAIAVNDQRISTTSTIRAAGDAILVDFRPVSGPYRVVAIGPSDMEHRFHATPTARQFREYVTQYGMSFRVHQHGSVILPAAGDPQLRYASPLAPPGASPSLSPPGGGR